MIAYGVSEPLNKFGQIPQFTGNPSQKFIKKVESNLPIDSNDISIALKLYNNLNDSVIYDEEFMAFNQDISIDFIHDIYNRDIQQINLTNNRITCHNWAELYCYFLQKNGIEAVVNKATIHKYVVFKSDGYLFRADATSVFKDHEKKFSMSDLTRRKLGLKPCGLCAFIASQTGVDYVNVYELGIDIDPRVDEQYVDFNHRTNQLLTKLKNDTNFRNYSMIQEDNAVLDKFSLINDLVSKEQLDTISGISYINNLIKIIFTEEEQKHLSYDYLKSKENENYRYIQLINYQKEEVKHRHDYYFHPSLDGYNFVYRGNGLEFFTRRKIKKLIDESDAIDLDIDNKSRRGK